MDEVVMTEYLLRRQLIFDIGMHSGQDTEFYLKKGFWVVAVEANPQLVEKAEIRFAEAIAEEKLRIEPVGIGDAPGSFDFYVSNNAVFSSFDRSLGERGGLARVDNVPMVTLDVLFAKYGVPYYLKVDIEGNDGFVFDALRRTATRPIYISVENGFTWMLEALCDLGYTHFKFINQAEVPNQVLPSPAREGLEIVHSFEPGASGAFGNEAPGSWLDHDEVAKLIDAYWSLPDRDASVHGWYDLHAARL